MVYAYRTMSQNSQLQFEVTPSEQRQVALRLMRLGAARAQRLTEKAVEGEIDMDGLFQARRGDQLVGAVWGQVEAGRCAYCWPPVLAPHEPEATAIELQEMADTYLDRAGVLLTQAILPPRDIVSAVRLTRNGYRHLVELHYLHSEVEQMPSVRPRSELTYQACSLERGSRMEELVEQSYHDTLDCRQLEHERPIEDVLSGYRETGVPRPQWWLIARYNQHDVGCLLMSDHPEQNHCELMYLGLVPKWRGRGWGYHMARYAQWLARQAGRARIVLAVDDANWPARQLYSRAGYQTWDRRSVYVRAVGACGPQPSSKSLRQS